MPHGATLIATVAVGFVLAFVNPPMATAGTRFRELTGAEQGPVKL